MLDGLILCGCGCGTQIPSVGPKGKPRQFSRGHQCRNRKTKGTEKYWADRLRKLNTRAGLCLCGCGTQIVVTLDWVQAQVDKRHVYVPRYVEGHMPQIACRCGCGTLIPAFDDKYLPRSYVPEHAGKAAAGVLKVDWDGRVRDWNARSALCACGCGEKLSRTKIQLRQQYRDSNYLSGHNQRGSCVTGLTDVEWSVVLGSLLGDLSISRAHKTASPRLAFTHCMAQVEYARHKTEVLSRLGWDFREGVVTSGYNPGRLGCRGRTASMPVFEQVWNLTRAEGPKSVTEAWLNRLDDRSLAYWYMDDGSVSWSRYTGDVSSISLHTQGYTQDSNELLARWLGDHGVSGVRVSGDGRGYPYLYMPRATAEVFLQRVTPYAHSSMAYKFSPVRDHGAFDQSHNIKSG